MILGVLPVTWVLVILHVRNQGSPPEKKKKFRQRLELVHKVAYTQTEKRDGSAPQRA